ncbi:MAG: hypothetical protein JWN25_1619 [Verrucomicrobiales bacterium]|nr:hypothetical protein [Verrucomicrobiales bacterium]
MAHGGVDRGAALVTGLDEAFHGDITQAPGGNVGDAEEANVIMRIDEHFEEGEEVLDFAPVKEALTANEVITDIRFS